MMKEEKILSDKFGKGNHFSVPEGYFDSFADKLMEQLPEPEARVIEMHAESWLHRLPLRKIAAVVGVAVVLGGGSLFFAHQQSSHHTQMAHVEAGHHNLSGGSEYGTFDEMADYTMMDNQDIYASLVAEN